MRISRIIAFSMVMAALTACGSGEPEQAKDDSDALAEDDSTAVAVVDTTAKVKTSPESPHPSLSNLFEEADQEFETEP